MEPEAWDLSSDSEENRVLFAALDSYRLYSKTAHYNVTHRRRQNFYALPTAHWQMLAAPPLNILSNLDLVDDAIDANGEIASQILETALISFGIADGNPDSTSSSTVWHGVAAPGDLDKARSTIRQLYRDWSHEGAAERNSCYEPVIRDVVAAFWEAPDKSTVKILVPGAGLGRLVFELCRKGYSVEGNEISYHQLAASNWILNRIPQGEQFDLYPFALDFSNVRSREHQLKRVKVPDVHAGHAMEEIFTQSTKSSMTHPSERMSMTAADFVVLYGDVEHRNKFDAVVTVFFIDTAPNIVRYVETVRNCLKDDGLWINLGPLLWHFADKAPSNGEDHQPEGIEREQLGIAEPGGVELSDEEILALVQHEGFSIQKHEIRDDGFGYIQNSASLSQNMYNNSHWIARKRSVG